MSLRIAITPGRPYSPDLAMNDLYPFGPLKEAPGLQITCNKLRRETNSIISATDAG